MLNAIGILGLGGLAGTVALGLGSTPPDRVQGELVRMIYIHPPLAWTTYLAFAVTGLFSALYLWRQQPRHDQIAASSAEVGVVLCSLTLVTGSLWGRPTWGVWWTWDARLTTTALLLALFAGYLALRRVVPEPVTRARRGALLALVAVADIPLVHFSVKLWRTLHQQPTLLRPDPQIAGVQAWTLLLGFASLTLVYVWLTGRRARVEGLAQLAEGRALDLAVASR
ncbi:MAG TPA: cytochrome c biogenesis protein CcsA [Acidimicrobiales bacterium]|nr:cytochrome c biogenesis protein CcsA [Acidimicrobiales bacterium]